MESIPEGTWEFVCHPGYDDEELSKVRTRLRESRAKELELLTSDGAREALRERGIQLIKAIESCDDNQILALQWLSAKRFS